MPLEHAEDARHGEAGERNLPAGIVTVDRVDQCEGGYLGQVVEEFAPSRVAARQSPGQRQVHLDGPRTEFGAVGMVGRQLVALAQQLLGARRRVDRLTAARGQHCGLSGDVVWGGPSRASVAARSVAPTITVGSARRLMMVNTPLRGHAAVCRQGRRLC